MFLVDTDVISATAPTKAQPREDVVRWLAERGESIFLSAITLLELRRGIALLEAKGRHQKAIPLRLWAANLCENYADRILPLDRTVACLAGELAAQAEAEGASPGLPDACIAATAKHHGLMVVTGNARHFDMLGIAHLTLWRVGEEGPR